MTRKMLITAAVLSLGLPVAPAAFAGDDDFRRGPDRDGDRRWRDDDHRDRDRHDHDRHEKRYVVHYHLDGGSRTIRVKSEDRADRTEDFLRSVGAFARSDGRTVHFKMRGERTEVRRSHDDAHRLVQKLQGYGFHARVEHR